MSSITRHAVSRMAYVRTFTKSTTASSFITDLFKDRKTLQQRNEMIVEKQKEETPADEGTKIVILNKQNAPGFKPFNAEQDMPGFKIDQWKSKNVTKKDIESTYLQESLRSIIIKSLEDVKQNTATSEVDFKTISLSDLEFRFQLAKKIQQNLGFDISDYIFSQSHDLETLYTNVNELIASRWTNERNPNAIALRAEDFSAGNVYLNEQLDEAQQQRLYKKLLNDANKASL